ncbi:helix-turn-helix transcriptional regulator [Planotetraspora thailandica]|uniref:Helix-turn-helix transcriptional regulator n=1 Tax=Planotetraspora thailandica TaxID=487172 RepID=A0A8J3V1K6_9ACTN|nr:LuxR family transcriptional regulator [Planotetraspora thailandica]GII54535.1 helix-turn-helix transcriptional regulator [Planotetraspora thailandica]
MLGGWSHEWAAAGGLDSGWSSWRNWRGRTREWNQVVDALRAARSGRGSVLLVEGRAGMGKSRLLAEAVGAAAWAGFTVGQGAADELDFTPLVPLRSALWEIAGVSSIGCTPDPAPADMRLILVKQVSEPLERQVARGPVLVALDDLHWADPLTLLALRCVSRDLASYPLVWVLSRTPDSGPSSPLDHLYDSLERDGAARIALESLDEHAVAEIASDALDAEPCPDVLALSALAEGNPFQLLETLDKLNAEGVIEVIDGHARLASEQLPRVQTITRKRIDDLSPRARDLVQVAGILGHTFTVHDLAAMLGKPTGDLMRMLDEAMTAGILVAVSDQLAFRHELLRRAVIETLAPPIRLALHREAAQMLLDSRGSAVPAASHLIKSALPGDASAIRGLDRAALEVLAFSPQTALDLSMRALEISDPTDPDRFDRVATAVHALTATGQLSEAARLAREALGTAPPGTALRVRCALAYTLLLSGRPAEAVTEAEGVLAQRELSDELRGAAESALFSGLLSHSDFRKGRRRAEAVLTDREQRDDTALVGAHMLLAQSALVDGKVADSFGHLQEAVRIASTGSVEAIERPYPRMLLTMNHKFLRQFEAAESTIRALAEEIEGLGQTVQAAQPAFFRSCLSLTAGRLDDAAAEAQEGLMIAEELGSHGFDLTGLCVLAIVSVRRGDLESAARHIERYSSKHGCDERGMMYGAAWGRWVRAMVEEAQGEPDRAMDVLSVAYTDVRERRWTLVVQPNAAGWMTRLALATANRSCAEGVVDTAESLARDNPDFPVLGAAAAHARGVLHRDTTALARAAADHLDPWGRASAAEDLGVVLLDDSGQTSCAVDSLERALDGYETMGALRDVARVRARLRELGVRHRHWTRAERPASGWDSLTDTERAVVALIAKGLTNRQAAAQMFLSPHTVSAHLRHIFSKLGIASRVELARLAAERHLVESPDDGDA